MKNTQVNNKKINDCEINLKENLGQVKLLIGINKQLHPARTIPTTFHKPAGEAKYICKVWIHPTENFQSHLGTSFGINER